MLSSSLPVRKTKIVCTVGPASDSEEMIRKLILAGADVIRCNFSHGTHDSHRLIADRVKAVRNELDVHTALMLDTKGPEIRTGVFKNGPVILQAGEEFCLDGSDEPGDESRVGITYPGLASDVTRGARIMIDDGLIELRVKEIENGTIRCEVINGGTVSDHKGINVPGTQLSIPFLSERDISDIEFGIEEGYDFISASFTQCAEDILKIRRLLDRHDAKHIRIIAKIENAAGVANCEEILKVADGLMVARGDMGVEIPMEDIPAIQKRMIHSCYLAGKQVITATQMLESMTKNPRPTRAEITDVANAVYDGTSAIMLSGETASGRYPVESVETMSKIAIRAESDIDYTSGLRRTLPDHANIPEAVAHAACTTASDLSAAAILTVSNTGSTARKISSYRSKTPILAFSTSKETCRILNMSWGVTPLYMPEKETSDALISAIVDDAKARGCVGDGDLVVITSGMPLGVAGTTNMLKVMLVGNVLASGRPAVPGRVCGTLEVLSEGDETGPSIMKEDTILAIRNCNTSMIETLRRAKAILCEDDDPESCAVVVGRTLGIPVVIGVAGATRILQDGVPVTVDGERGIVYGV